MKKRAVGYCRISTLMQVDNTSLKDQEDKIRMYAKLHDIVIDEMFIDKAVSGKSTDRPEYDKMMDYVKENTKIYKVAISKPHLMKSYEKFEQLYESIINPILDRFNLDNNKRKYVVNFYMKGIEAIINEWIKNDCKDDIDLIVNLLMELIKKHD